VKRMALVPMGTVAGSYCIQDGKDKIIFATAVDHQKPPSKDIAELLNFTEEDEEPGFVLPNGDINWQCPCMGGMVSGPCGYYFRQAFTCFHYSKAKPKGSDCVELFRDMSFCMAEYPTLYPHGSDRDDDEDDDEKSPLPRMN